MPHHNPRTFRTTSPTGVYKKHQFCSLETEDKIKHMFLNELYTAEQIAHQLNYPKAKYVLAIIGRLGATHKSLNRDMKDVFFIRKNHQKYLMECQSVGYQQAYDDFVKLRQQEIVDRLIADKESLKKKEKEFDEIILDNNICRSEKIVKLRDLGFKLKDIASIYNVTRERIRQIEEVTRYNMNTYGQIKKPRKLKHPAIVSKYRLSKQMQSTLIGKIEYNKVDGKVKSLSKLQKRGLAKPNTEELILTGEGENVKQQLLKQNA